MITKKALLQRLAEIEAEQGSCRGTVKAYRRAIKEVPMTRHDARYMLDEIRGSMEVYFYPVKGMTRAQYEEAVKAKRIKPLFSVVRVGDDKIEYRRSERSDP